MPVISNFSYYTENISAFLDYHLQPLAKKVKSLIKDTNDFLRKLRNLPPLPENFILCTINYGLYANVPHDEGLEAIRTVLDGREDKSISKDTLIEPAAKTTSLSPIFQTKTGNTHRNKNDRYTPSFLCHYLNKTF